MAKELLYSLKIEGLKTEVDRLAQLNDNINKLKADIKELSDTDKAAAEKKKLQLQQERKEYNDLQKQVKNNAKTTEEGVRTLEKIRAQLANMNKELERTEIGSERFKQLTADSKKLRDELKGAEEATGRFQLNVGDYKNAFTDAFQAMGINVSAFTGNISKLSKTFEIATATTTKTAGAMRVLKVALASTGIGLIVAALGSLVTFLTSTQEGIDKINSVLKPLGTVLQRTLGIVQELGGALFKIFSGDAKQGWEDLKTTISGVGDELGEAWEQGKRLFELSIEIRNLQLAIAANEGNINRQVAEQRAILEDVNRSDAERVKAGKQAIALQNALTELRKQELQARVDELKLQQEQNDTDIEGKKELVSLINDIAQLDADNLNKQREIQNKLNALKKEAIEEERAAILERTALQEKEAEFLMQSIKAIKDVKDQLREENADVIFRLLDEEEIDDIPEVLKSLGELQAEEVRLAQETTDKIKGTYTQRLEALQATLNAGLISEEQYANRKREINGMIVDDTIASLKGVAQEGSAIQRGLFVFEKALAVKKAFMAIIEGTSNTAKIGFPQNIPLLIGFAAQVAGLIGAIKGVVAPEPPKFATGVIGLQGAGSETSDSIDAKLSRGESVMTAKATRAFAPILAQMEAAVGNTPNFQLGSRKFATGLIGTPTVITPDSAKLVREVVNAVSAIPVVVAEGDITSTQTRVRRVKVTGDL